ncbi:MULTISPECIES: hypothetical protein [unclassified Saccharicrinis]|uniref:hypothetical protein n=1 Tax=unclassified Saccharicrinis TaxID=2646859 RepID=UPI003D349C0E
MPFDKERKLNELFTNFKRTDKFYAEFKLEFKSVIMDVILDYYPEFKQKDVLNDMMGHYATEVLSATESVLDKDKNYPEERKIEELGYMDRLLNKEQVIARQSAFSETVHQKVKELIVAHYPNIVDLSTYGFRLLERNMKMHLIGFISQFLSFVK